MPFEPPRELEFQQHELHRGGGASRLADDLVDRHRCRTEQVRDGRAIALAHRLGRDGCCKGPARLARHPGIDRPDRLEHIVEVGWCTPAEMAARVLMPPFLQARYWRDLDAGFPAPVRMPLRAMSYW